MLVEPLNALYAVRSDDKMRDPDHEDARVPTSTLLAPGPRPPKIVLDLGLVGRVLSNDELPEARSTASPGRGRPVVSRKLAPRPDDDVTVLETAERRPPGKKEVSYEPRR